MRERQECGRRRYHAWGSSNDVRVEGQQLGVCVRACGISTAARIWGTGGKCSAN